MAPSSTAVKPSAHEVLPATHPLPFEQSDVHFQYSASCNPMQACGKSDLLKEAQSLILSQRERTVYGIPEDHY
jgi:hypothetical protein